MKQHCDHVSVLASYLPLVPAATQGRTGVMVIQPQSYRTNRSVGAASNSG